MKGVAFSKEEVFSPEGRSLHNLSQAFYSTVMKVETPVLPNNQPKSSVIADVLERRRPMTKKRKVGVLAAAIESSGSQIADAIAKMVSSGGLDTDSSLAKNVESLQMDMNASKTQRRCDGHQK